MTIDEPVSSPDSGALPGEQGIAGRPLHFISATGKVGDDDACLHWLRRKYAKGLPTSDPLPVIENDLKACDSLHWSRFAFPSEPHTPLRANYNNETANPSPVTAVLAAERNSEAGPVTISIVLRGKGKHTAACEAGATAEPATLSPGHVLREVVLARDAARLRRARPTLSPPTPPVCTASASDNDPPPRPSLGGYVAAPPRSDSLRFLVFPQAHHPPCPAVTPPTTRGSGQAGPWEVAYYLRGSATVPVGNVRESGAGGAAEGGGRLSVAMARKFPSRAATTEPDRTAGGGGGWWRGWGWVADLLPFPASVAAADVELWGKEPRSERRYTVGTATVEKRTLLEDGVRVSLSRPDPRRRTTLTASRATVEKSHRRYRDARPDDVITGLTLVGAYDSAVQGLRPRPVAGSGATYRLQWTAGPGVEHSTSDGHTTVFARLATESWAEWPFTLLRRPFSLRVRNQSCLLHPLEWGADPTVTGVDGEGGPVQALLPSHAGEGAMVWLRGSQPHEYLWATQGPRWNPKLLRGFDNSYSNMHHSRRWYSVFSVELRKRKGKASKGSLDSASPHGDEAGTRSVSPLGNAHAMAFANACFVDSFREYPRASVGFSITSETPRVTVDAFNKLIPQKFECSFSWFVAFRERQLQTGLQEPGTPEHLQFMRVSPVETFRHLKCGLTWAF